MSTLLLLRHGETIENVEHITQGQMPGNLTAKGILQAKRAAQKLLEEKIDIVYSSDLKRCKDTASFLARVRTDLSIIYTEKLRETNFGEWEGTKKFGADWDKLGDAFLDRKAPQGESIHEMSQRVVGFLEHTIAQHSGQNILFVTHGGPIRAILAHLKGWDLEKVFKKTIANARIIKIKVS